MPYIVKGRRGAVVRDGAHSAGELNYAVTMLVDDYLAGAPGGVCYKNLNEVIGALECAKLELYRRIAAPYEDKKRDENGDVYICGITSPGQ